MQVQTYKISSPNEWAKRMFFPRKWVFQTGEMYYPFETPIFILTESLLKPFSSSPWKWKTQTVVHHLHDADSSSPTRPLPPSRTLSVCKHPSHRVPQMAMPFGHCMCLISILSLAVRLFLQKTISPGKPKPVYPVQEDFYFCMFVLQ